MQIDWWTLGLQAVNALVLVWLLAHFLFRPVVDAIARQPDSAGTVSRTLFVGLAMIETMAIYALVVALLVLFANPFVK